MTKTNAKGSEIGHEYQHIIALEMILKSADNDFIYIEEFGDVSNSDDTVEVKHHINHPSLSDKSIDFWKTLYNWCNEYEIYKKYSKLIFHTTSKLPQDSSFLNWNNLVKNEKYKIIKKIIKTGYTQDTEAYFKFIDALKEGSLSEILDKITLSVNNETIEDKIDSLIKTESYFKGLKNNDNRKDLLGYLLGVLKLEYIHKKEISVAYFLSQVRPQYKKYQDYEYVISSFRKNDEVRKEDFLSKNFLKELNEIKIDEKNQIMSLQEYVYAKNVLVENAINPVLIKELNDSFIPNVLDIAEIKKGEYSRDKKSYELFFDVTQKTEIIKNDFFENNKNFQNGNLHNIVDEKKFSWLYEM